MTHQSVDWKRVKAALIQYARVHSVTNSRVNCVMQVLPALVSLCGHYTKSRRMAVRIGEVLVSNQHPRILAPSCPDYTHEQGRYTFQGVGGSVPLLTRKHLRFLRKVCSLLPGSHVTILVADQEVNDQAICKAVGLTPEDFRRLIEASVRQTSKRVSGLGWEVRLMTQYIPQFLSLESARERELLADPVHISRLETDTIARHGLYRRIGQFTREEMLARTARTAAQYLVLGTFAQGKGMLICNHSTTSLSWYLKTRVGVLHNPITVY